MYEKEKEIFKKFKINSNMIRIITPIMWNDDHKTIAFKPYGHSLIKKKLTRNHILQMFECVKQLHDNHLVHRDLSPSHFYMEGEENEPEDKNKNVFVIDLGSSIFIEEDERGNLSKSKISQLDITNYEGSIQFAAKAILDAITRK